jgi:transposase InsO family protein
MHSLHPQARTTPAVRQEIARSREPTGVLAQRFSVSTETIRKWRKRGAQDCQDHSSRPHKLPWKATDEERAIVCALRQATGFPLDDLTFIVTHFLPHLNRDAVYRILKAEGLGRLPLAQQRKRQSGTFKDDDLGFVHIDIKHLPKLRTANGERRKRYLYVAIDRCSRWVHLAAKDDELATSAIAVLTEAVRAFPFKITHILTDRGSCFTADAFEDACRRLKLEHRTTKPYTPQTNGFVERFNGRVQREVLGITIYTIVIWRRCSRASIRPITGDVNACSRGDPRMRLCEAAWRPSRSSPTAASSRPMQTRCRLPSRSSLTPRRSRIQTGKAVCGNDNKRPSWVQALAVTTLLEQQIIHVRDDVNVRLETLFRARRLLKSKIMLVEQLIVRIDGSRIRCCIRNRSVLGAR